MTEKLRSGAALTAAINANEQRYGVKHDDAGRRAHMRAALVSALSENESEAA